MNLKYSRRVASVVLGAISVCWCSPALAATAPDLGTAEAFVVLGGSTVTNTGPTVLTGDLGLWPGLSIVGFPPGTVNGTIHAGDAVALQAQSDLVTAYDDLAGQACDTDLTGQDLGGLTLLPGAYCFTTSAQLTGTLTLDAQGDPDAVFVFQIGSSLTTASSAVVAVINGGSECNVFWQIGSSATLGTSTAFAGSLLALTSITVNSGASATGQFLARNGAVTLDTVNASLCIPLCPLITVDPATLPAAELGVPYSETISAVGGTGLYTFAVTAGMLPPGFGISPLTLTPEIVLSGTPTANGEFNFTITASDENGCPGSEDYTFILGPVTNILPIPTLSGWAMILLTVLLASAGLAAIRRPGV